MLSTPLPSRYRILEEVGQGGMAVVYRARDEKLSREVAVKVLHAHLLAEPESRARLGREARAVAKLNHDGILQVFDYSNEDDASSYIVTEFIEGQTLKQFLANRRLPVPELAALITIELGEALGHAHSLGILHRDVKPENVMVRKDGVLKLMDFGVAQVVDLERMTVTGQILGSPAYMAPEVLDGRTLDFRSDVFSVGVMLYQMATGLLPFTGRNPHEVLRRVADGTFADPRTINRLVSDPLARVIARALARKPEDRYPAIDAMVKELRRYTADAGLASPREELKQFLTDSEGYEKALVPRMVSALVASGVREQTANHRARVLELWNRALAFDPHNPSVLAELGRLERGEHLRRWAIAGGALAVLLLMAVGALFLARRAVSEHKAILAAEPTSTHPQLPILPPTATHRHKEIGQATSPAGRPQNAATSSNRPAREIRHLQSAVLEKTGTRTEEDGLSVTESPEASISGVDPSRDPSVTLTLGFTPARVEVWMDGSKSFDFGPQQNRIAIPWDRAHRLEFRNDRCCSRKEVIVGPQVFRPPGDHLFVHLDPKPARLTVTLEPPSPDARLLIREVGDSKDKLWRAPARPGENVSVPFDAGDEMRKSLEVVVFKGENTITKPVAITAGETLPVTIYVDE